MDIKQAVEAKYRRMERTQLYKDGIKFYIEVLDADVEENNKAMWNVADVRADSGLWEAINKAYNKIERRDGEAPMVAFSTENYIIHIVNMPPDLDFVDYIYNDKWDM